jgi:hypothetical protein
VPFTERSFHGVKQLRSNHVSATPRHPKLLKVCLPGLRSGGKVERGIQCCARRSHIARDLQEALTDAERQATSVQEWAAESFMLAKEQAVHYCVQEGSACNYDAGRPTF